MKRTNLSPIPHGMNSISGGASRHRNMSWLLAAGLSSLLAGPPVAQAQTGVTVTITVDNSYGLYSGTLASAITSYCSYEENCDAADIFSCGPGGCPAPIDIGTEYFSMLIPTTDDYLYIVAYSDEAVTQGVLAKFQASGNPNALYTGVGNWEVFATGIDVDTCDGTTTVPPTLAQINTQIALANSLTGGPGSSIGWVGTSGGALGTTGVLVFGEDNLSSAGIFPQVCVTQMGTQPQWMWFDTDPNDTIDPFCENPSGGGGHKEYLIFRLPLSEIPGLCMKQADVTIDLTTGVYDNPPNSLIPIGGSDDTWIVNYDPNVGFGSPQPAFVVSPHASWLTIPTSQWISFDRNGPNGDYGYQSCFCLKAGFQNASLNFTGRADDSASVFLNNNFLVNLAAFNSVAPTNFATGNQSLFQAGRNCIDVVVHNTGAVVTGFNLKGQITAKRYNRKLWMAN